MKRLIAIAILVLAGGTLVYAEDAYNEVRELMRAHLDGVTDKELDHAALEGLLKHFEGRVLLVTNGTGQTFKSDTNAPPLAKAMVFDDAFAYLRIAWVGDGLAAEVEKKAAELGSTNRLKGMILDLRFADGQDYQQAAAVADLFAENEVPLLEWKGEAVRSKVKQNALKGPVVVLVNHVTRGAGEVLAAILREHRLALIIGSQTAGQAAEMTDFKLKDGETLRIATAMVKVGKGTILTGKGLAPDIAVQVPEKEELAYLEAPFQGPNALPDGEAVSGTNRMPHPKLNEAELVRMKREGQDLDLPREARPRRAFEGPKDIVRDPALARGLDLLKGLSLIKSSRMQ